VVPGGGAVEATVSQAVEENARSLEGRQQLAADAFGTALMTVPRALATTAGLDGGRTVVQLRVAPVGRTRFDRCGRTRRHDGGRPR